MTKTDFYSNTFKNRNFPISLVTDHVTSDRNIGSLFRICDAYGVEALHICGHGTELGRKARSTSRSTEDSVSHEFHQDCISVVKKLKSFNYHVISLEITDNSTALHNFKVPLNKKLALIVGDERFGVDESVLSLSDEVVHVEMYGRNSSMNVAQAANAALYEITRQLL